MDERTFFECANTADTPKRLAVSGEHAVPNVVVFDGCCALESLDSSIMPRLGFPSEEHAVRRADFIRECGTVE